MPYHRYYDFTIDGAPSGFFEVSDSGSEIAMHTVFVYHGQRIDKSFGVRYVPAEKGYKVTAFRTGGGAWLESDDLGLGKDHYPSCAYPLLLGRVKRSMEYDLVSEEDGSLQGRRVLSREGTVIRELNNGSVTRVFTLSGDIPVDIDWGAPARSCLKGSMAEAVAGSPIAEA